jgi:hypothetical protein
MTAEWIEQAVEKATVLLAKWRKGRAKLWDYTPTHLKVTVRVELPTVSGNLHLVCGGCSFMRGPLVWDDCEIEVRRRPGESGGLILSDAGAGFELHCRIVSVEENVEPVYSPPNLGVAAANG